jgi:hypothetical protein
MSRDPPRTVNDYYANVYLRQLHVGNTFESDGRIEVIVRIPEQVAKTLAGAAERQPSVIIREVCRRVANVAHKTVPATIASATILLSMVDSVMPPNLPTLSNFKDEGGAEGWISDTSGVSGLLNLLSGLVEFCKGERLVRNVESLVRSLLEKV